MNEIIEEIRKYINSGYFKNEENIRFSLVARILQKLGWDIWNPKEVATEFQVSPNEDSTRVDIALFDNAQSPSVFIEIKALGKLETELGKYEIQLRDYNRNNTAPFSIITDGRQWRFYYSQTGGEFSQKCFKVLDLLNDDVEDIELSFHTFLSKEDIRSGKARSEAETYLKLSQKQRALEDALPLARRQILEPPFPSLPEALVEIVTEENYTVSIEEAIRFVKKQGAKKPKTGKPVVITPSVQSSSSTNTKRHLGPKGNEKCRDYLIPVIKLMKNGVSHTEAFKIIAKRLNVTSNTVSSQCTRGLNISTNEFVELVKSNKIKLFIKDKFPEKALLIEQEL